MAALTGGMPSRRETAAAIALAAVERLGPRRARWLVDAFGTPGRALAAFAADPEAAEARVMAGREDRPPLGAALRDALAACRPVDEAVLDGLEARGIRVLVYRCPGYPPRVTHLPDPPTVLYLMGPAPVPEPDAVTVVGTRKATAYGRRMARDLAAGLVDLGYAVVSGMALGIDGAAHRGALDAGGLTVGVLGSGFDHEYPAGHRDLYRRVRDRGLLVSEFAPEVPPDRSTFPRRNRILAALAEAVVVVQAPERSGALNTAKHAEDLGREVLAVPGPVGPPASDGVLELLRDGAGLAAEPADVPWALRRDDGTGPARGRPADWRALAAAARPGAGRGAGAGGPEQGQGTADGAPPGWQDRARRAVRARLLEGAADTDALAAASGLPGARALALLSRLELEGRIEARPGGRYSLAPSEAGRR